MSYLLFERGYCSELIELGYHDAMGKRAELERFLRIEAVNLIQDGTGGRKSRPEGRLAHGSDGQDTVAIVA